VSKEFEMGSVEDFEPRGVLPGVRFDQGAITFAHEIA
jgi:hypothetical protein